MKTVYFGELLILLNLVVSGIHGQVTEPLSTTIGLGDDVSLVCTTTENNPTFVWLDDATGRTIYSGTVKITPVPKYDNFMFGEATDPQTSILNIDGIELEDDGGYRCELSTQLDASDVTVVTVEVGSDTSEEISLESIDGDTRYRAVYNSLESKPAEIMTWILDDVVQTDGIDVMDLGATLPLYSTRSTFTFPATKDNYNVLLVCNISGHQVARFNRQESTRVDIHSHPQSGSIEIRIDVKDSTLGVTCDRSSGAQPTPAITNFYIYSNDTFVEGFSSVTSATITVPKPEQDTDFRCEAGNYLGNTTFTRIHEPVEPNLPEGTTSEPRSKEPNPYTCDGLSSGASAGIAVLAILLVGSVIINVIQFIVWRRHSKRSEKNGSQKGPSSDVRIGSNEANDNMEYEMIQSGDRAYTALKLSSSGTSRSATIDPENVTFLTRLGSIGRGDFGAVWKGELRSLQGRAGVAIRQIPDHVSKSTDVLQSVKVLCGLPDQPNVVRCLGFCHEQSSIIYEFISGGTLLTHLQTTGIQSQPTYSNLKPNRVRIDEGSLLNFAWQIAKGMQFLASKKIIHGTLCAHNVLLDERKKCKLSDYGLASSLFSKTRKPTRWSSPEIMVAGAQSTEGDIWSFGIVLWEIVTLGARPYPNMTFDIVQKEVTDGYKMPRPRHCGQEVYTIMSLCWEKETRKRRSFDQILKNLERILEKTHNYLSLNDLDEGLYASTLDM